MSVRVWLAFLALCLLSGSDWLLREWQPQTLPGLLSVALESGLLAFTFWAVHLRRGSREHRLPPGATKSLFAWSLLMPGLPTVVVVHAGESLSLLTETLVFALVPVFVVFFAAQGEGAFGVRESPLRLLAPALAGLAGAALLLPFHVPSSSAGQLWLLLLLASAAASAFAAVRLHQRLAGLAVLPAAAVFSTSIFILSAPLGLVAPEQLVAWHTAWSVRALTVEVLHALLFSGPVTLLTVWLLRDLPPLGFSARYPLVIALTIAEGYLLVRPETNWTAALGMALLLASGAWLLLAEAREVS